MGEHSPDLTAFETVLPAVLGITAAAIIAITAYICSRRIRLRNKKTQNDTTTLPFQPTRRPTAVRSPSGQPSHYLKKSPSPTTASKPLPGSLLSPSSENLPPTTSCCIPSATPPIISQCTNENEKKSPLSSSSIGIYEKKMPINCGGSGGDINNGNGVDCLDTTQSLNGTTDNTVSGVGGIGGGVSIDITSSPSTGYPNEMNDFGKLGALVFKLRYLTDRNGLVVSVVRCQGLPGKPATTGENGKIQNATDPYVKLQLLPEKQHKVKTRVVRNTRNPVYDEDFTFYGLSIGEISQISLHFVVLSFDRYSRDDVIGEVVCPLSAIDLSQIEKQQVAFSKEIQPRSLKIRAQGRGELLTSLCWQPAASRLTVVLLKARNLPRMDVTGLADPYVKMYLLFNGQRIAKKKTHVKKRTLSPVFNESFAFDIPSIEGQPPSLDGVSLDLLLLDWDRVTKNEVIGRLELGGNRCTGTALNHWNEVCNSPRRQIAEWHKLNE